VLSDFII
jgi:hypothetical protein